MKLIQGDANTTKPPAASGVPHRERLVCVVAEVPTYKLVGEVRSFHVVPADCQRSHSQTPAPARGVLLTLPIYARTVQPTITGRE
jgi:hypothetical protein